MKRVLIVDDEAPVRKLLRRWVEAEGVEVFEAATAEEGLEVARDYAPTVAFCDVNLPGRNGVWLADQLRAGRPDAAVILATGIVDSSVAITGVQAGVVGYLVKPFDRTSVVQALRRGLTTHASRRALVQVNESQAELETHAETSMAAAMALMQAEDPEASAQARRVARLAVNVALMLEIREPDVTDIERGALLNDAARLSLARNPILRLPVFRAPLDLAANTRRSVVDSDDIPLGAHIIAVARAYDDLVSGRAGKPVDAARAIERLRTVRRSEFDLSALQALVLLQPHAEAA